MYIYTNTHTGNILRQYLFVCYLAIISITLVFITSMNFVCSSYGIYQHHFSFHYIDDFCLLRYMAFISITLVFIILMIFVCSLHGNHQHHFSFHYIDDFCLPITWHSSASLQFSLLIGNNMEKYVVWWWSVRFDGI